MEEAIKDVEKFSEWMKTKIQSVHYANNSKMTEAYDRIFQRNLEITVLTNKTRATFDNFNVTNQ